MLRLLCIRPAGALRWLHRFLVLALWCYGATAHHLLFAAPALTAPRTLCHPFPAPLALQIAAQLEGVDAWEACERAERLELWAEAVKKMESAEKDARDREKDVQRREERKAREEFRALLREHWCAFRCVLDCAVWLTCWLLGAVALCCVLAG